MKTKTTTSLKILTECSIMIALATVLSIIKLFELPYGGSITVASMLPIVVIARRHGTAVGIGAASVAAAVQLLLGLNNLSYFSTWYSIVAIILLDYIVAFAVFGLSGVFRRNIRSQSLSMLAGTLLASLLRYVCHVISGATVWAGLSIPDGAALLYSIGYNATYMIPETIVLCLAVLYVGASLDLDKSVPTPKVREKLNTGATLLAVLAGFLILAALATDTVLVFSKLQSADTGDFMITGLRYVNWLAVTLVTLISLLVCAALLFVARKMQKNK